MTRPPLAEPIPGFPGAFWAHVRIHEALAPDFLTPDERALFATLRAERRKREWLGGRLAARSVARALGLGACSVLRGPEGGPRLSGPGAERGELAITHGARDAAAAGAPASSAFPYLGIDWVDARDAARLRRLEARVLSASERQVVADRDLGRMVAWGAREAVAKATRTGMFAYALAAVRLEALDVAAGAAQIGLPGALVRFFTPEEGAVVVVAGLTPEARFRARAEVEARDPRP